MTTPILLPIPRQIEMAVGAHELQPDCRIILDSPQPSELLFAAQRLQSALAQHAGITWSLAASEAGSATEIGAVLWVEPSRVAQPQGYDLTITPNTLSVIAHDAAGIFYGVCTLIQLLEQNSRLPTPNSKKRTNQPTNQLPCLRIADHPDFPARGVMLDISRDKVPTMETLYALVDMLAAWKINQLQLYTEHTFSYRNHEAVWAEASPITEEEILELDAYCRRRFVELVPNQNSFGHMHRWLKHDAYRPLAEVERFDQRRWWGHGPFGLCPLDPGSLELLKSLYDELLPNFSSRMFNVGCDETFDLGMGRSKAECERRGTGRVYLDFLLKIYDEVKARGRTMQFWGDIIIEHPELIGELPKDAIALEWGYQAAHPFDAHGNQFARSGVPFYVCPGTSTWNSVAGRTDNALGNLRNAAENGLKHGAIGFLNTDWGDHGHWQFLPVSYLGFAYGAGVSWCVATNRDMDIIAALNQFAFRDTAGVMGQVAYALGNVYQVSGSALHNASLLVRALQAPIYHEGDLLEAIRAMKGSDPSAFERAMQAIGDAMSPIEEQQMQRADADLIVSEYEFAANLLHHACGLGLLAHEDDPKVAAPLRRKLRADMRRIIAEYQPLWLARNREGGL
ncbi:MAG: family 20 glycosylhydrolase, partial [Chloroflexota bacterium]